MTEESKRTSGSRATALKLYDKLVKERQTKPVLKCADTKKGMRELGASNFVKQLIKPRQQLIKRMKQAGEELSAADKVALMTMQDLPALEISSLLQRLAQQLVKNPTAKIFGPENRAFDCG